MRIQEYEIHSQGWGRFSWSKMSQPFDSTAKFQSFAAFQTAFDQYRYQNSTSDGPLSFVRQRSKKLTATSFGAALPLDQQTIDRFVYQKLGLVCAHHRSNNPNKSGLFCEGRITIRFDRVQNALLMTSFIAQHSNHSNHSNHRSSNRNFPPLKNPRLSRISALVERMNDDGALQLVEDTCGKILEKWNGQNIGLEIHVIEKGTEVTSPIIKSEPLTGKLWLIYCCWKSTAIRLNLFLLTFISRHRCRRNATNQTGNVVTGATCSEYWLTCQRQSQSQSQSQC